jgi:hypothetical protein
MAQRPPPASAALLQSIGICQRLATEADRNEEISHPEEELADQYPVGSFVKAIFDSGGDADSGIPAFSRGDKFCVIAQHDGGWLSVPEGYLMVSWVVPCEAPPESQAVRDRCLSMRKRFSQAVEANAAVSAAAGATALAGIAEETNGPVEYVLQRGTDKLGLQITGGTEDCAGIFVFKVPPPRGGPSPVFVESCY